jgi:hypothetical protein
MTRFAVFFTQGLKGGAVGQFGSRLIWNSPKFHEDNVL